MCWCQGNRSTALSVFRSSQSRAGLYPDKHIYSADVVRGVVVSCDDSLETMCSLQGLLLKRLQRKCHLKWVLKNEQEFAKQTSKGQRALAILGRRWNVRQEQSHESECMSRTWQALRDESKAQVAGARAQRKDFTGQRRITGTGGPGSGGL